MSWLVFIALFSTKSIGVFFLRSAKADRDEMDGSDSDGFIGELGCIHRFWFQPKAKGYLLRLSKADCNEMYVSDSDSFIGELAGIHRLWFQPKAKGYFFAIS